MTNVKAKFANKQSSVTVRELNEYVYVEICLNEAIVTEQSYNEETEETYYEYDYNELTFPVGTLDIEDIKENPENYLMFSYEGKTIEEIKSEKIAESKNILNEYLVSHPLFSSAKYKDGRYYNATAEKQQHLTAKIMMATMCMQSGIPYDIKWNDTGNICEVWTIAELSQLAMEMDAYVTPLVTKQQEFEKAILEEKNIAKVQEMKLILEVMPDEV